MNKTPEKLRRYAFVLCVMYFSVRTWVAMCLGIGRSSTHTHKDTTHSAGWVQFYPDLRSRQTCFLCCCSYYSYNSNSILFCFCFVIITFATVFCLTLHSQSLEFKSCVPIFGWNRVSTYVAGDQVLFNILIRRLGSRLDPTCWARFGPWHSEKVLVKTQSALAMAHPSFITRSKVKSWIAVRPGHRWPHWSRTSIKVRLIQDYPQLPTSHVGVGIYDIPCFRHGIHF